MGGDFMRRLLLIPLAAAVLALGANASTAATHATKYVSITRTAFVPASVSVYAGDSITWTNSDTINHQVVSQSAGFASPILKPNQTFSFTFSKVGKFSYRDALAKRTGSGSVNVVTRPQQVTATLAADTGSIVWNQGSVILTGQLSSKAAGQTVTLNEQAVGENTAKALSTAQTDATGSYTFTVKPTIQTVYTVTWQGTNTATSAPVTVSVKPLVGLGKLRHRAHTTLFTFRAKATSDISYAGHYVYFQRYAPVIGDWIPLKRVYLGSTGAATFNVRMTTLRRNQVRVVLPDSQAGTGYLGNVSRTVLAVR
jgi:plastocyanin